MDLAPNGVQADETELSERDHKILDFERQWWKYSGAKEQAIRELFQMSATRYYQVLNTLLDNPAALQADPMLIKRLRRLRDFRQRSRSARKLGINLQKPLKFLNSWGVICTQAFRVLKIVLALSQSE